VSPPPPKDGPRDWDRELAEIDKLIAAGGGDAPPPAARGRADVRPSAGAALGGAMPGRRAVAATWLWFLLATLLGVGLTQWPYARDCGLPLYGYLGSIGAFGLASLWSTVWSWRTRNAIVHFLSIGLLFWGAYHGARELLPRVGYAKRAASWQCASSAAPSTPAPAPAAPAPRP